MNEGPAAVEALAEELAHFVQYIRFVSRDPANNRQRFYLLSWQRSLGGETALVCTWGRQGTQGRSRFIFFPDQISVTTKLVRLIKRRLNRGYQVNAWH